MTDIPDSHPRKASLMSRQKMVEASKRGLLAESAMIAHGRGEAFDYLLGEKTIDSASLAIREAAARLLVAESPVISMNGNSTVLAGGEAIKIASILGCPVEVNIYYRTSDRMESLIGELESLRDRLGSESLDKAGQSIMDVVCTMKRVSSHPDAHFWWPTPSFSFEKLISTAPVSYTHLTLPTIYSV